MQYEGGELATELERYLKSVRENLRLDPGEEEEVLTELETHENIALATTPTRIYLSIDHGNTWNPIEALAGIQISAIHFFQNEIYVGTSNNSGLVLGNIFLN